MQLVFLSGLFLCISVTILSSILLKSILLFVNIYLLFIVMYFCPFIS